MPVNPDFRDLFSALNDGNVEYLAAGAHAVMHYTEPRYTKDLDVWVNPTHENAERVYRALARFGAPLAGVSPEDFRDEQLVYQLGVAPNRIAVMAGLAGVDFASAWGERTESTYGEVPIHIMGRDSLIQAKKACGRPQDLLDLGRLQ